MKEQTSQAKFKSKLYVINNTTEESIVLLIYQLPIWRSLSVPQMKVEVYKRNNPLTHP